MGKTATRFTEKIQITPAAAIRNFGRAVAAVMDNKAQSSNPDHHFLNETDMKWFIGYVRRPDSGDITDVTEYVGHLERGTVVKLIGQTSNGKWWCEADVHAIPAQVTAKLEAHARRMCGSRARQTETTDRDMESVERIPSLTDQLDAWVNCNPAHDRRLACVARLALEKLVETGD